MIGEQLVGEQAGDAEAVHDLAAEDHAKALLERIPDALGDFAGVGLEGGEPFVVSRHEEVAGIVEGVETGVEEEERLEVAAAQARFFENFTNRGLGRCFAALALMRPPGISQARALMRNRYWRTRRIRLPSARTRPAREPTSVTKYSLAKPSKATPTR